MKRSAIIAQIRAKRSFLCVGLDSDAQKLPPALNGEPETQWLFNKAIIDATESYTVAYKINVAFYEAEGVSGWQCLARTARYIKQKFPHIFLIADAKRGDIGNTSALYARAFFEQLPFDAITVAPYMGEDSVRPFYHYPDKWVILLALTSNPGSKNFQQLTLAGSDEKLYERVIAQSQRWGHPDNTMLVVGATRSAFLKNVRQLAPKMIFLVPGVGAQGGDLQQVIEEAGGVDKALLINSSRGIIFSSSAGDFAEAAAEAARQLQSQMALHF